MKVTVLVENTVYREGLIAEHGLSLLIEAGSRTILFDAGQTEALFHNARVLGADLSTVDTLVISHGHYDHIGGMRRFLNENPSAKAVIADGAFAKRFSTASGVSREAGIRDQSIEADFGGRFIRPGKMLDLGGGLFITGEVSSTAKEPVHNKNLFIETDGEAVPDGFRDEIYLVFREADGIHIVSGCSHKGILNILSHIAGLFPGTPILSLTGGMHWRGSPASELDTVARRLAGYSIRSLRLLHCTGAAEAAYIKQKTGMNIRYSSSGDTF